jgi:voltage-gated potassium channel
MSNKDKIKNKMTKVDEYGMIEWKVWSKIILGFGILYCYLAIASLPLVYFESENPASNIKDYGDAFWLLQMAASTIGFGDVYPSTLGGKIITAMTFYIGVGLASYVGFTIASALTGFTDAEVQNRELRAQNAQILEDNVVLLVDNQVLMKDNQVLMLDNKKLDEKLDTIILKLN